MGQMPGNIEAAPAFAKQQELPAVSVGHLYDKFAARPKQAGNSQQARQRVGKMLEHVEERNHGETGGPKGQIGQVAARRYEPDRDEQGRAVPRRETEVVQFRLPHDAPRGAAGEPDG